MCAVFNEILAGRFNRALQKLFGMKGPPPVPQLGSEILPIQAFGSGVENRFLESWNRFGLTVSLTGAAGQFSAARWRNPSTSNVIAVFEKLTLLSAAGLGMNIDMGQVSLDLTGSALGHIRFDARMGTSAGAKSSLSLTSQLTLVSAITPTVAQFLGNGNAAVEAIFFEDQELTLLPGDGITVGVGTAAANFVIAAAWWRERQLEESERF